MPEAPAKSVLKSKTVWLNILILAAGIVGFVAGHEVIADYPQVVAILAAVQGGLNIILRLFTTQPVK